MNSDNSIERFPRLETKRLVLRELRPTDAEALFQVLSDETVMQQYDRAPLTRLEEAQQIIERHRSRFERDEGIRWGITIKGENRVVGSCGYSWHLRHQYAEIGYELARAYWNQGIITEALRALLQFGFETRNLHRVEAEVLLGNVASMRVLYKLGFQEEGILRERIFVNKHFYDVKLFSLLKSEFVKEQ